MSMRILHLIPNLSGGGAERQLSYLAPELVRLQHDVHIAYSEEGPQKPRLSGVELHRFKTLSNYDPLLFWQLIRLVRRVNPDIIHSWILQMDILGGIAAKFNGIPWIIREPSSVMAYPQTWKNRLRVWVGSDASAIISNSAGGDDYWKSLLPDSHRFIVPNGLPCEVIEKVIPALPSGLKNVNNPIVLYVGRLTPEKNLKSLFEVLFYVGQQQSISAIICGEGPLRPELEVLSHKLGLDAYINFTGYLPTKSVWALMKKAAVFVSLSEFEGCPNTVMEAMACNCPLIVSDISAHREILDESCALFINPTKVQQTADTIIHALCDSDTIKDRALIAKQKTQEWTIVEMASKIESIYEEFI